MNLAQGRIKLAVSDAKLTYLQHFGFHYVFLKLITKEQNCNKEPLQTVSDPTVVSVTAKTNECYSCCLALNQVKQCAGVIWGWNKLVIPNIECVSDNTQSTSECSLLCDMGLTGSPAPQVNIWKS